MKITQDPRTIGVKSEIKQAFRIEYATSKTFMEVMKKIAVRKNPIKDEIEK